MKFSFKKFKKIIQNFLFKFFKGNKNFLTLQSGKYFRTRGGDIVYCSYVTDINEYPCIMYNPKTDLKFTVTEYGKYYNVAMIPHEYDIIMELTQEEYPELYI